MYRILNVNKNLYAQPIWMKFGTHMADTLPFMMEKWQGFIYNIIGLNGKKSGCALLLLFQTQNSFNYCSDES